MKAAREAATELIKYSNAVLIHAHMGEIENGNKDSRLLSFSEIQESYFTDIIQAAFTELLEAAEPCISEYEELPSDLDDDDSVRIWFNIGDLRRLVKAVKEVKGE